MADTSMASTPKSKKPVASAAAPAYEAPKFEMPKFEMPKFEFPKFDMPSMEVPAPFREMAEKSLAQAKATYEKAKSAAEQATDVLEETYSTASKGSCDLGLKMIENTRANTNAAFDLYAGLLTAKSASEVVEKSTAYMRAQFETLTTQAKDLGESVQKVATETAAPVKEGFANMTKTA